MRGKGITYDTGFVNGGTSTHEPFDPARVRREMRVIRDDLHCTAVRLTGGDPQRLDIAAQHAVAAGLEVWFSPFTCDLSTGELLAVLADCAHRAERLRRTGAEVVLVTGAELSLFTAGFLPGAECTERVARLVRGDPESRAAMAELPSRINEFLGRAVGTVRERFGGPVGYAAIHFEGVDWTPFDFLSYDVYRTKDTAPRFAADMAALVAQGKPVALTEFGCGTFTGAADRGAQLGDLVEWDGPRAVRLTQQVTRDEQEQADCLRDLLDVFDQVGVDTAFLCTFACWHLPHRADPQLDLDRAGGGIVAVLEDRMALDCPELPWQPKAAFGMLADYYAA